MKSQLSRFGFLGIRFFLTVVVVSHLHDSIALGVQCDGLFASFWHATCVNNISIFKNIDFPVDIATNNYGFVASICFRVFNFHCKAKINVCLSKNTSAISFEISPNILEIILFSVLFFSGNYVFSPVGHFRELIEDLQRKKIKSNMNLNYHAHDRRRKKTQFLNTGNMLNF